ncbi:E3 ubiquitin-protein ligase ORTHRUS 1 [Sphaceloma murrayae]|uniref:E3 ubiquitin-protein ligase ORTHRUS 1 n=1 Tax=Sphaceloma murrayae TaxID=2082308 RepID=A0A2K1R2T3_9PEZI|nr:E3 ubiquitin-protein ligase ORTHRUS 1 [Sphaceloma murrayae]
MPSLVFEDSDEEYEFYQNAVRDPSPPRRAVQPNTSAGSASNDTSASTDTEIRNVEDIPAGLKTLAVEKGKRKAAESSPVTGSSTPISNDSPMSEQTFKIRKKSHVDSAVDAPIKSESSSRRSSLAEATPLSGTAISSASINVTPPSWYSALSKSKVRKKTSSSADQMLGRLKQCITDSSDLKRANRPQTLKNLIDAIHQAFFVEVSGQLIRDHFLLHAGGLPAIFTQPLSSSYPFFTKLDAENLYHKWANRDFGTDLMHGIKFNKDSAPSILPKYQLRRKGDVFGNNDLVNGQWWPFQICLVRDGCHNSAQGGIAGRTGEGAWSVLMGQGAVEGGGHYPDVDNGDEVLYCGTDGKGETGGISEYTQRVLESFHEGREIRLIRSSKARSAYAPEQGYRYDGLYKIVGFDVLDHSKQRHRFRMVRVEGQDPIRFEGEGKRPTPQELAAMERLKKEKKFIIGD